MCRSAKRQTLPNQAVAEATKIFSVLANSAPVRTPIVKSKLATPTIFA